MMQFINKTILQHLIFHLLLVCMVVGLASCASTDKKKDKGGEEEEVQTGLEGAEGSAEPFILIPNPYQPGPVPAQAKAEYANVKGLMEAKKWEKAIGLLSLMVETYPKLAGPYINLGIAHQALGEFEDAEKAFKFAIETNPQNLNAYSQLGLMYREQGRFEEAESAYLNALSIWPHHLPSAKNLGILYDLYMGRFEDALTYYELSQNLSGGEDRTLKGWIVDLKRRMNTP